MKIKLEIVQRAKNLREWIADVRDEAYELYPTIDEVVMQLSFSLADLETSDKIPPVLYITENLSYFRSQYNRNGLDGFVWNSQETAHIFLDAFDKIGATKTASILADCINNIADQMDRQNDATAGDKLISLRNNYGVPYGSEMGFDPIEEVEEALLDYLNQNAEEILVYIAKVRSNKRGED